MKLLTKIIYWVITSISFALLIISLLYNLKPEWFIGLCSWLGLESSVVATLLTTLGFGGGIGTVGFAITKAHIAQAVDKVDGITQATTNKVSETLAKLDSAYKTVETSTLKSYNDLKTSVNINTNQVLELIKSYEDLKKSYDTLIELTRLNLEKTIKNPLVDKSVKDTIKDKLYEIKKS